MSSNWWPKISPLTFCHDDFCKRHSIHVFTTSVQHLEYITRSQKSIIAKKIKFHIPFGHMMSIKMLFEAFSIWNFFSLIIWICEYFFGIPKVFRGFDEYEIWFLWKILRNPLHKNFLEQIKAKKKISINISTRDCRRRKCETIFKKSWPLSESFRLEIEWIYVIKYIEWRDNVEKKMPRFADWQREIVLAMILLMAHWWIGYAI